MRVWPFKACVLLGLSILVPSLLHAQGKITGEVRDSQSGDPLPAANVFVQGTNYGAATNLKGRFVITGVPVGQHKLVVRYIGYQEKIIDVFVEQGVTTEVEVELEFQTVQGEVVEVTTHAEGQMAAINQQLGSKTIANVVSEARIQELPDVNAAESIGRLPGVSIQRSGGEATKIAIRGLSPKYNTVTVNGVRVPATGGDDRSVDLSLISSNMLDGIEVAKAVTPDMDADVLGGSVDLRLKEAPPGVQVDAMALTGYNRLQDDYGNYNFASSLSNRFMNDRLGLIVNVHMDNYNRSADKFSGDYRERTVPGTEETEIVVQSLNLREEIVDRGRTGASFLLDYRIPWGKMTANSFYNRLEWDGLFRINRMDLNLNRHYYDLEERGGTTSIFTGAVGVEQDFEWLRYDLSVSRTASRTKNPDDRIWTFVQEANAFTGSVDADTHPTEIPALATNDSNMTGLADVFINNTRREEDQTALQFNLELPFRISNSISGLIKTGGKLRWLDRLNDENQIGRNGLQYGNSNGPNPVLSALHEGVPEWNIEEAVDQFGLLPVWVFSSNYSRSDFLNGEYPLGFTVELPMMKRVTEVLAESGELLNMAIGSRGRDYDGIERYQAGYIMAEFNLGKRISFLPGVRWERDYSKYNGQRYREVVLNNIQQEPTDLDSLAVEREHDFWLPMVHLQVRPTDWLRIRLARTKTLTRPDYIQYAPITSINSFQSYIRASNSLLRPAQSTNYDAAISIYESHIGLVSVAAFYKSIDDLIFQTRLHLRSSVLDTYEEELPGLNIPESWVQNAAPIADTFINSPFEANYKGFELDWQTHLWYLPSVLRGLVLNVNYTRIFSETEKRLYFLGRGRKIRERPPIYETVVIDSSRTARMPDQPAHIANITIGYDYKGFSARLSFLYQTDQVTFLDRKPELDHLSGSYARWDLAIKQNLGRGFQVFANFNNLNSRADRNFRGATLTDPTFIEYYGFTMDVGARYRF